MVRNSKNGNVNNDPKAMNRAQCEMPYNIRDITSSPEQRTEQTANCKNGPRAKQRYGDADSDRSGYITPWGESAIETIKTQPRQDLPPQ